MKKLLCLLLVSFVAFIGRTQSDADRTYYQRYRRGARSPEAPPPPPPPAVDAGRRKRQAEAQRADALRRQQEALLRERQKITNQVALRYPQPISPENRIVGGKLHNVKDSVLWKPKTGECVQVTDGGILVQQFRTEVEQVYGPRKSSSAERMGLVVGGYSAPRTVISSKETQVPTQTIFLKDFPEMQTVAEGKRVSVRALLAGTVDVAGRRLECWDCGLADTTENRRMAGIPVPTPEQIAAAQEEIATALKELDEPRRAAEQRAAEAAAAAKAAKAKQASDAVLQLDQEKAAEGSALYQYRMGRRYLTGNGVEKDLAKARELLEKAAGQGNQDAATELAKLSAP